MSARSRVETSRQRFARGGHLDRSNQGDSLKLRRADTPRSIRVELLTAAVLSTDAHSPQPQARGRSDTPTVFRTAAQRDSTKHSWVARSSQRTRRPMSSFWGQRGTGLLTPVYW
jgi:hypothetical protein